MEKCRDLLDDLPDGDEECVHDLRVALRRIRTAFLFAAYIGESEANELRKGCGKLARKLGAVRNLDVLIDRIHELPEAKRWLNLLRRRRTKNLRAASELAEGRRFLGWGKHVHRWLSDCSCASETPPSQTIVFAAGRVLDVYPTKSKLGEHALRIRCKHLRYLLEFLHEPSHEIQIGRLQAIQDRIGEARDLEFALQQAEDDREVVPKGYRASLVRERRKLYRQSAIDEAAEISRELIDRFTHQLKRAQGPA